MVENIGLRFRDLVKETIPEHQQVIDEHGEVWWGWWNKPDEKVPFEAFAELSETAQESGLEIYLVHSGKSELYKAELADIEHQNRDEEMQSPDPAKTPEYYRDEEYKAWFKFQSIEEVEEVDEELQQWSYVEVEEFFADASDAASRYHMDDFHGKRVFDIEELINLRHRTIYFFRGFREGEDPEHKVDLIHDTPAPFMTDPIVTDGTYIVHISDIHFSDGDHHAYDHTEGVTRETLANKIIEDVNELKDSPPAAVLFTGDFTWTGSDSEFDLAQEFVDTLRRGLKLEYENMLIIPGNHDIQHVDFGEGDYERGERVTESSDEAKANYERFYRDVFNHGYNEQLAMGRKFILANGVSVDLIGLNSSLLEQEHFAGNGFVTRDQFNFAVDRMGWNDERHRSQLRILALHHHVLPIITESQPEYDMEFSVTLDAAEVLRMAEENQVDLISHGHMHQPFTTTVNRFVEAESSSRGVAVHGTGSAGVGTSHVGPIGRNCYSIYDIDINGIDVHVRSTDSTGGGFNTEWTVYLERGEDTGLRIKPSE